MKKIFLFVLSLCFVPFSMKAVNDLNLSSPLGKLRVKFEISDKIYYSVYAGNELLTKGNSMRIVLTTETIGENPKLQNRKFFSIKEKIHPLFPLKFSEIENPCNCLLMNFKGNYALEARVYDDGFAYRFILKRRGETEVKNEIADIRFPSDYLLHLQEPGSFKTSNEEPYSAENSSSWSGAGKMSELPVLIDTHKGYKILMAETDVQDYPRMFVKGNGENGLLSVFPKVPLQFGEDGDRSVKIQEEADYVAKISSDRTLPWRYFIVADQDGKLVESTLPVRLAPQNVLKDVSWIHPGQVSWEWWNGACPYGPDVNFVSGCNEATYKYFIDFASKYGIPYIIMDEGWAKDTRNPYEPNPDINLHELIQYGKQKNVGIVLWLTWLTVDKNPALFKTFHDWGIKGVKIDFMDRGDQWMVDFYERTAKLAAENELFVDFHGAFKPGGLEYKYPNILSYEGVRGMEQMGGCTPDNSLYNPFMRNVTGPMDYTPGAMTSMQPEIYCSERPNSASIGTRAYQMALFVVFESGLQMLADNPTLYYRNEDCTKFITSVPVTWNETRALAAEAGKYVVVAKRKGEKWFIGAICNGEQKERVFDLKLDFLPKGKSFRMTSFEDGINAGRQAMDYRKKETSVDASTVLSIKMVRNGGFAAVIE